MPRGIKGSGPYSKFPKEEGAVTNDLAAPLRKTKAPAKKPVAKAPAKPVAKKVLPKKTAVTNGNGNGHASVSLATKVEVGPEGALTFTDQAGKKQTIALAHPFLLLDLEKDVKVTADNYVKALADSRK